VSNDIRRYDPDTDWFENAREMTVTAVRAINVETNVAGFDRRVSLLHHDGDVFRLYMTGSGHDEMEQWEIVSCPYDPEIGLADMTDLAAHGWVVGAEVVER